MPEETHAREPKPTRGLEGDALDRALAAPYTTMTIFPWACPSPW